MGTIPKLEGLSPRLRRSKSMCSLRDEVFHKIQILHKEHSFCGYRRHSRTASDSSVEVCLVNDSDSEASTDGCQVVTQRALEYEEEVLATLEQKIDRLSDLFLEQCRLLSSIKTDIHDSRDAVEKSAYVQNQLIYEIVSKTITQKVKDVVEGTTADGKKEETNSRARSLLEALDVKRACSIDRDIRDALAAFLQSDELKERVVASTSASVRDVVRGVVSRDVTAVYLPALERQHRRLLRHATRTIGDAFVELEENSSQLSKQMFVASRSLRRTLERHLGLLDAPAHASAADSLRQAAEEVLDCELKQWRMKALDVITAELRPEEERAESPPAQDYPLSPLSPPQPADPEMSIIDRLVMKSAEINKLIQDGDVNSAFSRALSAGDLSLVMAACRAAAPAQLSAPPRALAQPVLLSLTQQLATDMVHETQLKCRYLEEAIINLDTSDPATRAHVPLVVNEVRKHLMKFLLSYPKHVACRRVTLIVMAADNLLKHCT